jgi:hypothetical protein
MLRTLQYVLLVGSIGLVGADRIDFFAGRGPFTLTPFLILASLSVLVHLLRAGLRGSLHFAVAPPVRRQAPFLAAASLFLILCFASIPFSLDPERSLVAFADLLIVAVLGYYISLQILAEPAQERLILRSLTFGLVVYIIFCIGECIAWSRGIGLEVGRSGPWLQSTFAPSSIGPWLPTLAGTTFDANRSGFILTMYLVLLDRLAAKARYAGIFRFTIALLVLLTISKSGALCWSAYYLSSTTFWKRLVSGRVLMRLAAVVIAGSLLSVVYQDEIVRLAEGWEIADAASAKLSMDPGSSGESHILLIQRGYKTWLSSPKTIVMGIGEAAAPNVLQDFFENDKHGNFHNLYVTVLAEMGFPAFIVLMFLLGYPIIGRNSATRGMAALMVFNVSYQSHNEPVFWLTLALLWSCERRTVPLVRFLSHLPQSEIEGARA